MKILLAIDGSAYGDAALEEVCRRPWPEQSEVRVITVITPWADEFRRGKSSSMFDELNQQLRGDGLRLLNAAIAALKRDAPGLRATPVLREGWPKDAILHEAQQWGADLVVLGSQGRGTIERLFLGSVSLAVATHARCSVEIVRAQVGATEGAEAEA